MIMSKYEEYAHKAEHWAQGSSSAGVVYALLALGERMHEFTEFAKATEERDQQARGEGDLFMGHPGDIKNLRDE